MAYHPLNLVIRFLLELLALLSFGLWAWRTQDGWIRLALVVVLPLCAATAWGVFAVPDDPSRSGSAPIPVPGLARLILELGFFGLAGWALHATGLPRLALSFLVLVASHYAISVERIQWLLGR